MFYVLIQSRCSNAWITLDFVLQRMDHCLQYLPKSEKKSEEYKERCTTDPYQHCRSKSALQNPYQRTNLIQVL